MKRKISPFIVLMILLFSANIFAFNKSKILEGDIIFQETLSLQAKAIKAATKSRYTHMGIIFKKNRNLYVFEAVQPVRITKLNRFINRGINNHFVIKRLKNRDKRLTLSVIKKMKKLGRKFIGKNYDIHFMWNDKRIYCSELVWKIYYRVLNIKIGNLKKLHSLTLTAPM